MLKFWKSTVFAALLAGIAGPVMAADIYYPPEEVPPPPSFGGWYIRGHIGMSNQSVRTLDTSLFDSPAILDYGFYDEGFGSAPVFGVGAGYQFNHYLRGDLTAEWRGKSDFDALDWVTTIDDTTTNDYRAKKSELLLLANAYADLGNFYGITPYIGAGIGASRNTISGFRDVNVINGGGAYAAKHSEWNLAWALHAGVGLDVSERATIDFGYSFVSLGDARTGEIFNDDPAFDIPNDGFHFNDLYSHDLKVGLRYRLN